MHHTTIVVNGNVANMNFVEVAKLNQQIITKDAIKIKMLSSLKEHLAKEFTEILLNKKTIRRYNILTKT